MKRNFKKGHALARVDGSPGARPRLMGYVRATWPLMIILAAAGYLVRAAWPVPDMTQTQIGFLLLLLCGVLAGSIVWSEKQLASFNKGARGEEETARALYRLSSDYHVFHGLRAGRVFRGAGDYDHVVVGPTGLFVVETKNWSGEVSIQRGEVLCNGVPPTRPPLEQVKSGATDLQAALKGEADEELEVHPILCFVGGRLAGGTTGVGGVIVCVPETLCRMITEGVDMPLSPAAQAVAVAYLEKQLERC